MSLSAWVRQIHRWLAVAFTVVVFTIFAMLGAGKEPAQWVYYLPLAPLALLMLTGLYMFVLPYAGKVAQPETSIMSDSQLIDSKIAALGDWRGATLARVRSLIKQADPEVVEEVKWRKPSNSMSGVPTWSHDGIICTGETYKDKVKMTFAKGASLEDPAGLFNSSLDGNTRRAIDLREGDTIDEKALKALIGAAVALNTGAA